MGQVWVDFTVVNPMADSYKGKDAIKTAEAKKRSKYDQCAANENVKFTPAGADVFGNLGDNLEGLLHTFAHHAYNTHPYSLGLQKEKWIGQRKKHMRERLVITIAYANYLLVDEAIMKVSHQGLQHISYTKVVIGSQNIPQKNKGREYWYVNLSGGHPAS